MEDTTNRQEGGVAGRRRKVRRSRARMLEESPLSRMFRDVLESIPVRVFWKDMDGRFMGCNRLFAGDAGRDDPESLIGEDDYAMGWAEQAPLYRADDRRVIESGQPKLNYEEPQTAPDGRTIWLRTSKIPLRNEAGQIYGVLGVYEDITERKQAELELRESAQRFDQIARQSRTYIWEVDPDGLYIFASSVVEDLLGYRPDEIVGKLHYYDLHPPEGREAFKEATLGIIRRMESFKHYENVTVARDGRHVWVSTTGFPLRNPDGSLRAYRGSDLDISERKQAEERAARRTRQLQGLSASLQDINSTLDIGVILRQVVASARDVTGAESALAGLVDGGEMVFREYNRSGSVMPVHYRFAPGMGVPGRVMQTRKPHVSADAEHDPYVVEELRKVLGIRTLASVPIILRDGRLIGCIEVFNKSEGPFDDSDIEMLKGLAAGAAIAIENTEHLQSQKQAEERTREANRRLKAAAEELARSNRDLEQMAFVAAHDLKEPLRMVTSFMDLLQSSCGNALDERGRECVTYALEGGERMQNLVEDLLRFAQVGRSKVSRPTDLNAVLATVCLNLKKAIEEADAVITHDPLPVLVANPEEMAQLLQNLIANAVKFRGDRRPEIHIGVRLEEDRWLLSVRDNGMGFDPHYAEKIFVIFQRLHTREQFSGTGIGLAICKKIVERHGGRIWAESVPGQGTTFWFTLPQAAGNP